MYGWDHDNQKQLIINSIFNFVQVYGPKTETFVLSKSGDSDELSLPGSTFFYMKSDVPFQASKMLFGTTSGTCVTPLLPSTLWLTEYVFFTQPSSTVEFPVAAIIFLITELPQFLLTYNITEQCLNIEGNVFEILKMIILFSVTRHF